jgi:excisionase family DNA binding protein
MATNTYTTAEAAAKIGISRQTLQAWIADEKIRAPKAIEVGKVTVRLWSDADIEKARKFLNPNRPGPRSKKKRR